MENRAGIEDVCQQSSEGVLGKWTACSELSTLGRPTLQRPAPPVDLRQRENRRTILLEQSEDLPHSIGLRFIYQKSSARRVDVIAQDGISSDPFSLAAGSGHLVAGSFADQFPFKLRKREQDVQSQPSERCAGVELLRDRDEADFMLFEDAQHSGEVKKRPAEAIYLIHHNTIQRTSFH